MKKMKSMLISMGAITTLTVPVVLAVSCENEKPEAAKPEETTIVDQTTQTGNGNPTGNTDTTTQTGDEHQGSTPASHPVIDQVKSTVGSVVTEVQRIKALPADEQKHALVQDVIGIAPEALGAVMTVSHLAPVQNLITSNIDAISTFVIGLRDKLTELLKTVPVINGLLFEKQVDSEGNVILDAEGNPMFANVKTDTSGIDKVNGIFNQIAGSENNIFTTFNNLLDRLLADARFILEVADASTLARLNDLYYGVVSTEEVYKANPEIEALVNDVNSIITFVKSEQFANLISNLKILISDPREFVWEFEDGIAKSITDIQAKLEAFIASSLSKIDDVASEAIGGALGTGAAARVAQSVLNSMHFSAMIYSGNNFHTISNGLINNVANNMIHSIIAPHEGLSEILGQDPLNTIINLLHGIFDVLTHDDILQLLDIFISHESINVFFENGAHASFKTNVYDFFVNLVSVLRTPAPAADATTTTP